MDTSTLTKELAKAELASSELLKHSAELARLTAKASCHPHVLQDALDALDAAEVAFTQARRAVSAAWRVGRPEKAQPESGR